MKGCRDGGLGFPKTPSCDLLSAPDPTLAPNLKNPNIKKHLQLKSQCRIQKAWVTLGSPLKYKKYQITMQFGFTLSNGIM
ncbi:unnamed protein product [Allacma fusca]|uniref:Uncharacterized protein n=1 Tax=Allacma fusca TaxID=39272 RepID=A0A8J2PLB9_9HEXA|nr:unnamed protein product [Allacma fusca]